MNYDPVARLAAHTKKLNQSPGPLHWLELLRLTRLLMEYKEISSHYPVLTVYCHWMLHANLDRTIEALKILQLANDSLRDAAANNDIDKMQENMSASFRLGELRSQLSALLKEFEIDTSWLKRGWPKFLNALLDDLSDRPIAFREGVQMGEGGPGKSIFEAIVTADAGKPDVWPFHVVSLHISRVEHSVLGRPAGHYWNAVFLQQEKRISLNGYLSKPL